MKSFAIYPEHRRAAAIFLAIFALTAMLFFFSCASVERPIRESNHRSEAKFRRHADGCNGGVVGFRPWRRASLTH